MARVVKLERPVVSAPSAAVAEYDAAVECARRALRSAEAAAEGTPARNLPDLAAICRETALLLRDRDPNKARALMERSVALYSELVAGEPDVFGSRLSEAQELAVRFQDRCNPEQ